MKKISILMALMMLLGTSVSCSKKTALEEAGDKIEDGAEDVGDKAEDVGDKAEDIVD